ncbi:MAG: pyridine nucleotide-disulfide oxidoreductase [Moraxellaceae bacterium]|jgi:sulfide:quinone oxidoreductase|nr:pyridine nucleotide-disulfide oxidoreductase [Moraxellaceae bacterium]
MAHIVVIGAGLGGLPAAYDLRKELGQGHEITVVNPVDHFQFTPSNPWVAVGWRTPAQVVVPLAKPLARKDIRLVVQAVSSIEADRNRLVLADGSTLDYDYLIITTGPKLAFDEVPGLGPEQGGSQSVCSTPHAEHAWKSYQQFLENPGPIVVGAAQGASCFGPAYEFAMILDADLRKRKLRHKVPITFVTSEPYIGHMGLGGVGDSKGMLESNLRQRHIKWITNAKLLEVTPERVKIAEHDDKGQPVREHDLPQRYSMFIPAFKGVDAVAKVEGLCNPRGFVIIDEHQRSPKYRNIFSAGVCVAIPPVEVTPVPTGAPKTGYMIESMVTAIVENIKADLEGREGTAKATWNALCLADMGDDGAVFIALPQIPPRNVTWSKQGYWVHLAKIGFEKYFMRKMRVGNAEPIYEKYVLKTLGILRLQDE